jgi:hypothetical protein
MLVDEREDELIKTRLVKPILMRKNIKNTKRN